MKKTETAKTVIQPSDIRPGMVVRVHQKIKEINPKGEEKERIQIFEGLVIKHRGGNQPGATMTVRKISEGVGVERIYPLSLPSIAKLELVKQYEFTRAKLYHVRHNPKKMDEMAMDKMNEQVSAGKAEEKTAVTA